MIWNPKFTDEEYARMLLKLQPPGDPFPHDSDSVNYNFMLGFAQELRRIDEQIHNLITEAHPGEADQLIAEWEIDCGFPDECYDIPITLSARRLQVVNRIIFPGHITTGWADAGNVTAGSQVITGLADTTDILIGDAVHVSAGFQGGKYLVIDKTASTVTLEQTALKDAAGATLTGYFYTAEPSERFFKRLLILLGYSFFAFEYYDKFLIGPSPNGYTATGDPQIGSDTIINVSSTAGIEIGQYLWISAGFDLTGNTNKELKVLAKTANTVQVDRNAAATAAGADLVGFNLQPSGMGDPIGAAYAYTVLIKFYLGAPPADTDILLKCVFNKLKPAHTIFLYQTS